MKAVKTERLPPDPKGTALALQRIGYSLEEALSDLIDNSLDAGAKNVLIRFFRNERAITQVAVVDDGEGMDEATLHRAMQYGVQVDHRKSDLGKYGIGLKTASFSQCQSLSVFSKQNGIVSGRRWTLTRMQDDWRCEILDAKAASDLFTLEWGTLSLEKQGTIILWDHLDALGEGINEVDKLIRKITRKLPVELGLRFHRFIATKRVALHCDFYNTAVQGAAPILIPAVNPFGYGAAVGKKGYPITLKVNLPNRGTLDMVAHIWPAKSESFEYKMGGGQVAERQGFYFYRNDRLIQGGGWNGVRESDSEPHSSLARVSIDLPISLDAAFGLTIQKSKVVPPPDFKTTVLASCSGKTTFEDYISAAVETYRDGAQDALEESIVPGLGWPVSLQRKIVTILGVTNGDGKEIAFEWKSLESGVFFEPDVSAGIVYLNADYRPLLVDKGAHSTTDIPLIKSLLFLLLSPDLRKARRSKKTDDWHKVCNAVLVAALRTLR